MSDIEEILIGRTIKKASVDGFEVYLKFDDGTEFTYEASDGGYSTYCIEQKRKARHKVND